MPSAIFDTSNTWVCPAGVTVVTVECWGGGGCGSRNTSTPGNTRAGGGGGAYARGDVSVTPGESYTVTVGTGGISAATITQATASQFIGDDSEEVMAMPGGSLGDNQNLSGSSGGSASSSIGTVKFRGGHGAGPGGGGGGAGSTEDGGDAPGGGSNSGGIGGDDGGGNGGSGNSSGGNGVSGFALGGAGGGGDGPGTHTGGHGANGRVKLTWITPGSIDLECIADTVFLSDFPTLNNGAAPNIQIGENNSSVSVRRSLIKFDLSDIPDNAIITGATLYLFMISPDRSDNARTYRVFRSKRAWVEGTGNSTATGDGATWNTYDGTNNWQTAGGFGANDCEQTDIGTMSLTATETLNSYKNFTLTPTSKAALDLGNGWLLKADTETNDLYIYQSRLEANPPILTVSYILPEHNAQMMHYRRLRL